MKGRPADATILLGPPAVHHTSAPCSFGAFTFAKYRAMCIMKASRATIPSVLRAHPFIPYPDRTGKDCCLEKNDYKIIIESLLFSSEAPLKLQRIQEILPELNTKDLRQLLAELTEDYERLGRSFSLREVANGYLLCTRPEFSEWIHKLKKSKPFRLGSATMETLAIVAYKQPITRSEIEDIRGVDIGGIIRTLLEKKFIKILGKKDVPGKPLLYGTTPTFLTLFGLKSLSDLPALEDIEQTMDPAMPLFAGLSLVPSESSSPGGEVPETPDPSPVAQAPSE